MDPIISCGSTGVQRLLPHCNPGLEIIIVRRGTLRWMIDGRVEVLPAGSVFFTLPWQAHGTLERQEPGNAISWLLIKLRRPYGRRVSRVEFHRELALADAVAARISHLLITAHHHTWNATPLLVTSLDGVLDATTRPPSLFRNARAIELLRILLMELAEILSRDRERNPAGDPTADRVRGFIGQLTRTCGQPWTLAAMAGACGLKRTQFSDVLRDLTGETPLRLVNRLRINQSRCLLLQTDRPITRIALECGFGSSQYFARVFRQFTAQTPEAYRRTERQQDRRNPTDWTHVPQRTLKQEQARWQAVSTGQMID